jgi:hypothetical protein
MPKEKTKIRVRIRKSRTGAPYSDISYNAPGSTMFSVNQPTLFQKPAVRAGLLIGAAVIALIAAALIVTPFRSEEAKVTKASDGADTPPLSSTDQSDEQLSTAEDQFPPSSAAFPYGDAELPPPEPEAATSPDTGLEESAAPQTVVQAPNATPSLEALEAEEARKALEEREAEGVSAVREALTMPQTGEPSSPGSEPPSVTQTNDVFAPQPSVTPESPAMPVPAPVTPPAEEAADSTAPPAPEAVATEDAPTPDEPKKSSAVARAQFAHSIVEREPTDAIDSVFHASGQATDKIYYFTELIGLSGETITHRWEYEGEVMATVVFDIGGNRWRVYSSKTLLPSMAGQWRVVVVDAEGNALQANEFTYAVRDS